MRARKIARVVVVGLAALMIHGLLPETAEGHGLGTVRRTSRRVARRTTHRVTARHLTVLPPAHTTVVVSGVTYYMIDGVRYVRKMQGGQVVYVVG
jgi:hypothetical protein